MPNVGIGKKSIGTEPKNCTQLLKLFDCELSVDTLKEKVAITKFSTRMKNRLIFK